MKKSMLVVLVVIGFLTAGFVKAYADVIDFEGLEDSISVTNQYSGFGVVFSNTTVIKAGLSLNESEFPPYSGTNVAFDDGGFMTLMFSVPMANFSAYFNYVVPLTLSFYDVLNNLEGTVNSAFASNLLLSGDLGSSPNEPLSFAWASGISSVVIAGAQGGSSFTMDDLTLTPVPEPATLILLGCGIIGIAFRRFK
jgi:hypothetical protein